GGGGGGGARGRRGRGEGRGRGGKSGGRRRTGRRWRCGRATPAATSRGAATTAATRTGVAARRTSDPDPSTEETLRPPEEHRDHDHKGDGVLVGVGHVAAGQRLREPDQKAGGDRSVDVAEAARH